MPEQSGDERRKHVRIHKNYILKFYQKDNPSLRYDISQVINVSKGGLCFISTFPFDPLTEVVVDLRTPFLTDGIQLEGSVLESREKASDMLFEVRIKFSQLSSEAYAILDKIERYNKEASES